MRIFWIIIGVLFCFFSQAQNNILLPAKEDNNWGFIDNQGNWIIQPTFTFCGEFQGRDYAWAQKNGSSFLIDKTGKTLGKIPTNNVIDIFGDLVVFKEGSLLGWLNSKTQKVVTPAFDELVYLPNMNSIKARQGDKYGIIDSLGSTIIPFEYDQIQSVTGFYHVMDKKNVGILNKQGENIVPIEYASIRQVGDFFLAKGKKKITDIYSFESEKLASGNYTTVRNIEGDIFSLGKKKRNYLMNVKTGTVFDSTANYYAPFSSGYITIGKDSGVGLFSISESTMILPCEFQSIYSQLGSDFLLARKDFEYSIYTKNGEQKSTRTYDIISSYDKAGLCLVYKAGKYGVLKSDASELFAPQYQRVYIGADGVIKAKSKNAITLFELNENQQISDSMQFTNVGTMNLGGQVSMRMNNGINRNQNLSGYWFKNKNGKWGMRDTTGSDFIKPVFDEVIKIKGTPFVLVKTFTTKELRYGRNITLVGDSYYGIVNENTHKIFSPFTLLYVDTANITDTSMGVFRVMLSSGTFASVDKNTGRVYRYTSRYMDAFSDGYARIFVGLKVKAGYSMGKYINVKDVRSYADQFNLGVIGISPIARDIEPVIEGSGYWAYIGPDGKYITNLKQFEKYNIAKAGNVRNQRAVVQRKDSLYGLLKMDGNFVLQPNYKRIAFLPNTGDSLVITEVKLNRKGYIKDDGRVIAPVQYSRAKPFQNGHAWANTDGFTFLIKENGTILEHEGYLKTTPFSEGYAGVAEGYKYAIVDTNFTLLSEYRYSRIGLSGQGKLPVKSRGRFGYIDDNFNYVINPEYFKAGPFNYGMAMVRYSPTLTSSKYYGYIDSAGKLVKGKFSKARDLNKYGFAEVRKGRNRGIISHTGKIVVPVKYRKVYYGEGYYTAVGATKTVVYDTLGEKVKKVTGKARSGYSNQTQTIKKLSKYGAIDNTGKKILGYKYSLLTPFENGVAASMKGKETHLIDLQGDTIKTIQGRGDKTGFHNGHLLVKSGKFYWYANSSGKNSFFKTFEKATNFKDGLAIVNVDGKQGLLDSNGFFRILPEYDRIYYPENGVSIVEMASAVGVCDLNSRYVIAPKCTDIKYLSNSAVFQYKFKNQYGYFNRKGELFFEVE